MTTLLLNNCFLIVNGKAVLSFYSQVINLNRFGHISATGPHRTHEDLSFYHPIAAVGLWNY